MCLENDEQLVEGLDDFVFQVFDPREDGEWARGLDDPPGEL
jgi:hypothetical protein